MNELELLRFRQDKARERLRKAAEEVRDAEDAFLAVSKQIIAAENAQIAFNEKLAEKQ